MARGNPRKSIIKHLAKVATYCEEVEGELLYAIADSRKLDKDLRKELETHRSIVKNYMEEAVALIETLNSEIQEAEEQKGVPTD